MDTSRATQGPTAPGPSQPFAKPFARPFARPILALIAWLGLCLPSVQAFALDPREQQVDLRRANTDTSISFTIALPEGYTRTGPRYPVIYHLHGKGSNPQSVRTALLDSYAAARAQGLIEPVIIVFPQAHGTSFWADSKDGRVTDESDVLAIVAYVNEAYHALPDRRFQVSQGFSMGGFGAAKFAAKYPDLFAFCMIYDGALLNWSQMQASYPAEAASIFGGDGAYFNRYSPWQWVKNPPMGNGDVLPGHVEFRQAVGLLSQYSEPFRNLLTRQSIAHSYADYNTPHSLPQVLAADGGESWRRIQASFDRARGL